MYGGLLPLLRYKDIYIYYLLFVDDYSHFVWTFPMKSKYEVYFLFTYFKNLLKVFLIPKSRSYVLMEVENPLHINSKHSFNILLSYITSVRLICLNRIVLLSANPITLLKLLVPSFMMPIFLTIWVNALSTATYLINLLSFIAAQNLSPYQLLHNKPPPHAHLRVFVAFVIP